jgi:hypothetical protein
MTAMRPNVTAARDQSEAGTREANALLDRIAAKIGAPRVECGDQPRLVWDVLATLNATAAAGNLTGCGHVRQFGHAPVRWTPVAPDKLRCEACYDDAVEAAARAHGGHRCDSCGIVNNGRNLAWVYVSTGGSVRDRGPDWPPLVTPPVLIGFLACSTCAPDQPAEGNSR